MSPLVKTIRQTNFKDLKRFGAFKGLVEQKNVVFNSFVPKNPNLHKNSSNKLLFLRSRYIHGIFVTFLPQNNILINSDTFGNLLTKLPKTLILFCFITAGLM
jgi:hypothetical protein